MVARNARFIASSSGDTSDSLQEMHKLLHLLRAEWMTTRAAVAPITFEEFLLVRTIYNQEKSNG